MPVDICSNHGAESRVAHLSQKELPTRILEVVERLSTLPVWYLIKVCQTITLSGYPCLTCGFIHIGGLTVPAYAAAKHGVTGVIKALSNEWSSKGIDVNGIAPGYINTDMNTALLANPTRSRQILERIPAGRWGKPEDFEGVIVYLASRASDYTGKLSCSRVA